MPEPGGFVGVVAGHHAITKQPQISQRQLLAEPERQRSRATQGVDVGNDADVLRYLHQIMLVRQMPGIDAGASQHLLVVETLLLHHPQVEPDLSRPQPRECRSLAQLDIPIDVWINVPLRS